MDNKIKVVAKGADNIPHKIEFEMSPVSIPDKPGISIGIDETKDVVEFGIAFANGVIETLGDGKVTVADIPNFLSSMIKLPAAISGIDKVPAELGDLDKAELAELTAIVKDNLKVDDKKAAEVVEASINFVYSGFELLKAVEGVKENAGTEGTAKKN